MQSERVTKVSIRLLEIAAQKRSFSGYLQRLRAPMFETELCFGLCSRFVRLRRGPSFRVM
jgi:exoribonuclease II